MFRSYLNCKYKKKEKEKEEQGPLSFLLTTKPSRPAFTVSVCLSESNQS